jgi:hypothetical protein
LIYFYNRVNINIVFFKKRNIWTKRSKVQKTNRDHTDFGLLGSQVCLGTKKLRGKKQIILPINSEGISHTKEKISFEELVGAK